ncbi:8374_t:CDS:2 [Entrophospora sp. SA101]|nr:8374_t:CDS:2 [Entrophospora sp. SA101]
MPVGHEDSSSCLEEVEEQQKYNKRGEENATNESIGEDYNSDDLDSEIIESQQISRRLRIGVGFRGRSSRCNVCARYCVRRYRSCNRIIICISRLCGRGEI